VSGGSSGSGAASGSVASSIWTPSPSAPIHFHWQLSTPFATTDVLAGQLGNTAYDIDGENATAAGVAAIHASGAKAICYVDVGSLEQGRSDYAQFPKAVVGPGVAGWPGENWLLVTAANQSVILPLMKARITSWCKDKGFDAVEPDNLDAWTNIPGVTEADNLSYDVAIAAVAHSMSLSIGLKNTLPSASAANMGMLVSTFDWSLVEQCYEYTECGVFGAFISAGKAVWDVEYNTAPGCAAAATARINAQRRDLNLAGPHATGYSYAPCVPDSQATW
jgi:hypothetical protein